jgi:hypothetical protein
MSLSNIQMQILSSMSRIPSYMEGGGEHSHSKLCSIDKGSENATRFPQWNFVHHKTWLELIERLIVSLDVHMAE